MKLSKLSCAVLSVIALSACGGGGGSSGSHNNQEEPQPQPQPIEETGVVVQDFQFNAFSSLDAAEVVTGGNFDSNSKTTVCLDLSHDNSCQDEQYSVSGTGLSFSNKLEWPEDLDVSGMNIIADNNNFVYSIPADSGINGVAAQGTSVQKRIKVYINPASNALHADKLGKDVILGGYTGAKYSSNDFSAQKDYSALDQEIITFADTLVSVLNYSNKEKLAYTEVRDIVSGALQKIIDALKDLSVSPVQIVVSVDTHNDYNHLANNVNPDPEVPVTNNPPVADFNFEVSADGAVIFSNNSSDPENDKLTYKWKFGDNAESDEASPTHKYKKNGKYTVYLNVTDSGNLSNYITKEVNVDSISEGGNDNPDTPVADENNAPIAYFYYEDTDEGLVKFTNNSSDPDNDKLTYKWNFGDNSESNKKSPNHTFKKNGMYTVTLTVTDSHNLTSTITKDVIVASVSAIDPPVENSAPVANFSYEDTDEGLVKFTNNSSDPDNDKLTYKWNFGDNSESNKKSPNHTFKKNGKYTVTLTVTDSHNLTSTITKDIIVASVSSIDPSVENHVPVANFSYSVDNNLKVTFINTSTDSDGDELSSIWCIQGTECFDQDDLEYSFSQAGTYKVSLSVNDGNKISTITKDIKVDPVPISNNEPIADFTYTVGSDGVVAFSNNSSDPDGDSLTYTWKFGDASVSSKKSPTHKYTNNGTYTVYLKVTDTGNLSHYVTKKVKVDTITKEEFAAFSYNVAPDGDGKVTVSNTSSIENVKEIRWDFGDGTDPAFGDNQEHTYSQSGEYAIELTVTTNDGTVFHESTSVKVDVADATELYCRNRESSSAQVDFDVIPGSNRIFTFINRSHDEAGPLTYKWEVTAREGFITQDFDPKFVFSRNYARDSRYYDVGVYETDDLTDSPQIKVSDSNSDRITFGVKLTARDICGFETVQRISVRPTSKNLSYCVAINHEDLNDLISEASQVNGYVDCEHDMYEESGSSGYDNCKFSWKKFDYLYKRSTFSSYSDPTTFEYGTFSYGSNSLTKGFHIDDPLWYESTDSRGITRVRGDSGDATCRQYVLADWYSPDHWPDGTIVAGDTTYRAIETVPCGGETPHNAKILGVCKALSGSWISFSGNLAVPVNEETTVVNINTVSNAMARLGSKVILGNYSGTDYDEKTFSPSTSYDTLDDNVKLFGDTVFYFLKLFNEGQFSKDQLKQIVSNGLEAVVNAKSSGISDVQIIHDIANHRNYDHLHELQPYTDDNNRAPTADFTCLVENILNKDNTWGDTILTTTNLSSDPDNDELSYYWRPVYSNSSTLPIQKIFL